jgi:hypothetical protein
MTTALRIVGIVAVFIAVTVGAVFATDALMANGDAIENAATADTATGGGDTAVPTTHVAQVGVDAEIARPVDVTPRYWVDTASDADDPLPPPPLGSDPTTLDSGLEVLKPPSGEPTDHPENVEQPVDIDGSPVPIGQIEAEAAVPADEDPEADPGFDSPDQIAPQGVPAALVARPIRLPMRFADPCAVQTGGECPFGVPAIVALNESQQQLQLAANVSRGEPGRMLNGAEGCPADFVEGEFNIWIATTIPSAIEFRYNESLPLGATTVVSLSMPGQGDPEYDRWVESQSNGAFDTNNTWSWFRTCMSLDLEPNVFYEFRPLTATAPDGQVVTYARALSISTVTPGETIGRPAPTFVYGDANDLTVHVWEKDRADGYRAYVWPIDLSDPEPPTCSDIEADLFADGGRIGTSHPDFRVQAVPHDPVPATPNPIYDSEYAFTQQFDMALREGRTYTVCIWEARLGTASFDEWEIAGREQYDVVTPNSHPIAMNLVRVGVREDSDPHDVKVYAENHDYCDSRGPVIIAPVQDVAEGTRITRAVFCESWGLPLDPFAFTRITVDREIADTVAIPLDAFTNCGIGTSDPGCAIRTSEYIAHTVEIPGSCDPECGLVDVRFRVDYLPSNGGGGDTWSVGPEGTFDGMEPTVVAGPDVDIYSLTLDPVAGRVDQMRAGFLLKSQSDYTITAIAPVQRAIGDESCNSTSSGSGDGPVEIIMEDMCADTQYVFKSIVLTDAEGMTTERDLLGTVAPVWTNGYASFLRTDVSMTFLDEEVATARCAEADARGGFSRGADADCWSHLGVSTTSPVTLGGAQAYALNFPSCVGPNGGRSAQFGVPPVAGNPPASSAVVVGDVVSIDFRFLVYVMPECGSGGNSSALFEVLEEHRQVSLDELNEDIVYTFPVTDGIKWTVRVQRTDAGVANRRP